MIRAALWRELVACSNPTHSAEVIDPLETLGPEYQCLDILDMITNFSSLVLVFLSFTAKADWHRLSPIFSLGMIFLLCAPLLSNFSS